VSPRRGRFETTEWSLVLAAQDPSAPRAEEALADLCQRYWYPVYSYVRGQGHSADDALDLTQGFFARLLEKEYLRQVDRDRGRFRAFLLTACRHFLSNARDHQRAQKRGGRVRTISIDATAAEDRLRLEPRHDLTPEKEFERRWALTLIADVLADLRREMDLRGKAHTFDALRPFLVDAPAPDAYAAAARELGSNEGAVRVAVHRLRRQFRERLRDEIARTVDTNDSVDDERRVLFDSLA
jgi:RNA polymerase sigma-70 factor (ECF subfamily)